MFFFCFLCADFPGCAGRYGSRGAEGDWHQCLRPQTQTHQGHREAAGGPARSVHADIHLCKAASNCWGIKAPKPLKITVLLFVESGLTLMFHILFRTQMRLWRKMFTEGQKPE